MATDTNAATSWHTVVPTALGELTLVRDAEGLLGLHFPRHWYMPNPVTFGPRRDGGFDEAAGQLGEYLAGQRHEFDLQFAPRGNEFQQRVWNLVRQVPSGSAVLAGLLDRREAAHAPARGLRRVLTWVRPCAARRRLLTAQRAVEDHRDALADHAAGYRAARRRG